jgi:hypothetical protein
MEDIKLNKHGVNAKINATILPDKDMRKIGFTDYCKDTWYFCRMIKFPNIRRYKGFEVSFNVSIKKSNSNDLQIDILDEAWCQPYDYQTMLERDKSFEPCLVVKEQVEEWMKYLQDNGVLSGHEHGKYI